MWRGDTEVSDAPPSRLIGFVDWDFAAPGPPLWDLAFVALSWVPLHSRDVAASEGFTAFEDRPRRLRLLLAAYGYDGAIGDLLEAVQARLVDHIEGIEELAGAGDPLFGRLLDDGVVANLERARAELAEDAPAYEADPGPRTSAHDAVRDLARGVAPRAD